MEEGFGTVEDLGLNPASWRGRRVLVTGHTGFKGSWLALWLQELGARVCGLSLAPDTEPSLFTLLSPWGDLGSHLVDLRDQGAVEDVLCREEPEVVFHLAAQALVPRGYREPVETFGSNVMGTVHLLEAVRRLAVAGRGPRQVVVATTDKVYEHQARPCRERDPLGGEDPYSASKAATELAVAAYRRSFLAGLGVEVRTLRAGNVLGGGDFTPGRLVPDVLAAFSRGEPVVLRCPAAIRPWQHVLDPLSGYLRVAEMLAADPGRVPEALNLGPGRAGSVPVETVVAGIRERWGSGEVRHEPVPEMPENPHLELDAGLARRSLGWKPRWNLARTLDATVEWHRRWRSGESAREITRQQITEYARGAGRKRSETGKARREQPVGGETFACRSCGSRNTRLFLDLGSMPSANAYLPPDRLGDERAFPLRARLCEACLLVQLDHVIDPAELFTEYAYFSSYSQSWLEHSARLVGELVERFRLGPQSFVVEVASNDGYLLRNFVDRGIPVLGIEPAANVAAVAEAAGVPTLVRFFGAAMARELREERKPADLVIGNNVLAHVPDLGDFCAGLAALLAPEGVVSLEYPHLLRLIQEVQFDTIYHEHFSYLSLLAVSGAMARHGLRVFDVAELPTHGGSLRTFVCRREARHGERPSVAALLARERAAGLADPATYQGFGARAEAVRAGVREFFARARAEGATVAGYGAAAKGNTLLNYCGVTAESLPYVVDRNPVKQGRCLPGSHIPVRPPEHIFETRPDYLLILPWNLEAEIRQQMAGIRGWGGRFVTAVPEVRILA